MAQANCWRQSAPIDERAARFFTLEARRMSGGGQARSLEGYSILVTRPAEQAQTLLNAIAERGGKAIFAPMIVIQGRGQEPAPRALIARLADYQVVIFVSRNAAEFGVRLINEAGQSLAHCTVYAVGGGSESQLKGLGVAEVISPPTDFTSEGLLKLPGLAGSAIAGKRVLIVRGVGGRELLAQKLLQRGATVDYCEVYARTPPVEPLADILRAHGVEQPDLGLITSLESLTHLAAQIDQENLDMLYTMPLLVAGARTAQEVERLGFSREPVVVESPADASLLNAIERWVADER
jgi:uroporphyrinogen-III synthase